MSRWEPGDVIAGRFTIEGRLAAGGMAEIFVAEMAAARGVKRRVALKRIHPHLADDPEFVNMFLDEARVSSHLSHPGIVPVLDAVEDHGDLLLVLEYVPGWDLATILRTLRMREMLMPLGTVLHVLRNVAATLAYVHAAKNQAGTSLGIVHRDVTPSNILIAEDGSVRLLDFGVAKAAERVTKTATAGLKGKLSYLSPEQARGSPVSAQTDLYSLGLVAFELATNRRALGTGGDLNIIDRARNPEHTPLRAMRAEVPMALGYVVDRLLAVDPEDRPRDGNEVVEALSGLEGELPEANASSVRKFITEIMQFPGREADRPTADLEAALARVAGLGLGPGTDVQESESASEATGATAALSTPTGRRPPQPEARSNAIPETRKMRLPDSARPQKRTRLRTWLAAAAIILGGSGVSAWILTTAGPLAATTSDTPSDPSQRASGSSDPRFASPGVGFLRVRTSPAGAEVLIDGQPWTEQTPTVIPSPGGEARALTLRLADYRDKQVSATAAASETVSVSETLERLPARLVVESDPSGATVTLDGEVAGTTPLTLEALARNAVVVRISKSGFGTHRSTASLDAETEVRIHARLREAQRVVQYGTLDVSTTPWAQVSVRGRVIAESTPATGLRLPVGTHTITLTNPRLNKTVTRRVTIRAGRQSQVIANLR